MRRVGFFLLGAIVVASTGGCDGDRREFNLFGTWRVTQRLVQASCALHYESGLEISVVQRDNGMLFGGYRGTFDPSTGAFALDYTNERGVSTRITGRMSGDASFQASKHLDSGVCSAELEMKGELLRR